MNSRAFFLSVLLIFFTLKSTALAESGNLCVQTFNIYGPAYASNVERRVYRTAEELLHAPCASMHFQEFWRESHYSAFESQMRPAKMAFIRADQIRGDKSIIGLASGFSGSVLTAQSKLFSINNQGGFLDGIRKLGGVEKGFTLLEAKTDHGPTAIYANLHTHPSDEAIRLAQITQLIEAILENPKAANLPLILTGDLNATPDSLEIALLQDVLLLKDSYLEVNYQYGDVCTYCASNPLSWSSKDRVIDFILMRNSPTVQLVVESSKINLQGKSRDPLSDHFGLRSELHWLDRTENQLNPSDDLVQSRRHKAIATLNRAKTLLGNKREAGFRVFAGKLAAWEKTLSSGKLPESFARVFLTP